VLPLGRNVFRLARMISYGSHLASFYQLVVHEYHSGAFYSVAEVLHHLIIAVPTRLTLKVNSSNATKDCQQSTLLLVIADLLVNKKSRSSTDVYICYRR
jgi:hypothetical protein